MQKRTILTISLLFVSVFILTAQMNLFDIFSNKKAFSKAPSEAIAKGSFHDFKVKALTGNEIIDFSKYKGKKVIVINVASKCGYTPQYADWEAFYEKHKDKIEIVGFPANDFMRQEPGSNDEIAHFCQKNYGVTFQMLDKVSVKGKTQHEVYKWLSDKSLNGWNDKAPSWNFCKYVVDENGKLTNFFASDIKPNNLEFLRAVGL
jgi:glutathione peroxidase